MKRFYVDEEKDLKNFIAQKLDISKNKAKEIIDSKNVFVNDKRIWIATHMLKKGDIVEISLTTSQKWSIENSILYEDDFIISVQKPPFLESENKKGSVEDLLRKHRKDNKIKAIHRLDRETSGVLLFAKNLKVFDKFKELWHRKEVGKKYLAISHNEASFKKKVINEPIDKKYAKSIVKTLKTKNGFSLFEVEIKTGRKHQIRIHLSKLGFPIVGDKIYGIKKIQHPLLKNVKRHMLHSHTISFFHPFLKKKITIKAKPFGDFENFGKSIKLL
jgi:RluA family pseudouridine synthase